MATYHSANRKRRNAVVGETTANTICREVAEEYGVDPKKLFAQKKKADFGRLPDKVGGKEFWDSTKLTKALRAYAGGLNEAVVQKAPQAQLPAAAPAVLDQKMALEMQIQMNRIEGKLDHLLRELGVKQPEERAKPSANGQLTTKEPAQV